MVRLIPRSAVNLWRIPLWLTLCAFGLFGLTIIPDTLDAYGVIHLPFWLTMGSIDDARAILSAMLGCVSTVLALIFSVALLVLSMVATLFGPRLLYRFLRDWVTQTTLGVFLGTFVYLCLVFLVTHSDAHSSFVPQISLLTSWLLVLVSFAFLVFYSHRIAVSIQNPSFIARIVDDLARIAADGSEVVADEPHDEADADAITSALSGYVQRIDHGALVAAAANADAVVRVAFRPGQFVFAAEPIAHVWPKGKALDVARSIEIGRQRAVEQDAEFALAQIVEIGIRALSPAVNDSFTGVACVDWLGDALVVLADAPARGNAWRDAAGKVRLWVRPVALARLAKMAFDQMRQAAVDNPAVLVRMLDTFRRIAPRLPDDARAALRAQAEAIREAVATGKLAKLDRDDIEAVFSRF